MVFHAVSVAWRLASETGDFPRALTRVVRHRDKGSGVVPSLPWLGEAIVEQLRLRQQITALTSHPFCALGGVVL
jgi:hypothetical protein